MANRQWTEDPHEYISYLAIMYIVVRVKPIVLFTAKGLTEVLLF